MSSILFASLNLNLIQSSNMLTPILYTTFCILAVTHLIILPSLIDGVDVELKECTSEEEGDKKPESKTCDEVYQYRVGCCPGSLPEPCSNVSSPPVVCPSNKHCVIDYATGETVCLTKNTHEDISLWNTSSRSHLHARLGKECNHELYNSRMRPIWQLYLQCPKNKKAEKMLQNVFADLNLNPGLLRDICFSQWIEECNSSGLCQCYSETFKTVKGKTFLDFDQVREVDHCGQKAGNLCAHNTKDKLTDLAEIQCHEPDLTFSVGDLVPDTFECEVDAFCKVDEKTKQCKLGDTCRCTCATDHTCIGGSDSLDFRIMGFVSLLFNILVNFMFIKI